MSITPSFEVRDRRDRGWFWMDNVVIDSYGPVVGAEGIAVYATLARFANKDGEAWPSYGTIAKRLHMSRPTVVRTIRKLEIAGLLTKERRTTRCGVKEADSNIYILLSVKPITEQEQEQLTCQINKALGLNPRSSKANTPQVVKEINHLGSKTDLPQVVKEINQGGKSNLHKQDSLNKTHVKERSAPRSPRTPVAKAPRQSALNGFDPNVQIVKQYFGKQTKLTPAQVDLIVEKQLATERWDRNVKAYAQKYSRVNVPAMLDWYARDEAGKQQSAALGGHAPDDKYAALRRIEAMEAEYERQRQREEGGAA